MKCSNCGKQIPFTGDVCPYCHADKSGDQTLQAVGVVVGLIGAGIGYACADFGGAMVGGICGAVCGFVLGMIIVNMNKSMKAKQGTLPNLSKTLQKTTVKVSTPAQPPPMGSDKGNGEGQYRITGVDKQTKMDTVWHTRAVSAANAKVKAELEGIIVTDVLKV